MAAFIGKPPRDLTITDNPKDFEQWLSTFQNYLTVVEIGKTLDSPQKHALLLNCIGEDALKIVSGLSYDSSSSKTPYENLVAALKAYFIPKKNLTYERYRFRKMSQDDNIMTFVNELHRQGKLCEFDDATVDSIYNQSIRDQFILGLSSDSLRTKLLSINELTLEQAVRMSLAHESGTVKSEEIRTESLTKSTEVLSLTTSPRPTRSRPSYSPSNKTRDREVRFSSFNNSGRPFCNYCKKAGHVKRNCFLLNRRNRPRSPSSGDESQAFRRSGNSRRANDSGVSSIFTITGSSSKGEIRRVDCTFYDENLKGMVDTGSSISLISRRFVDKHQLNSGLIKVSHTATMANGQPHTFRHAITGPLILGETVIEAHFYLADWLPEDCLLGMNILNRFSSLKISDNGPDLVLAAVPSLMDDFADIFDKSLNDACYNGEIPSIINLQENSQPFQSKIRRFSPHDETICKEQITNLLSEGIIRKSMSPWRHMPVIVSKRSGGHRLAVDYRPVNSQTKLDAFPTANLQDLIHSIGDSKIYSSLDFSQFYHQLPLDKKDQEFTAFYAFGDLYEYQRCPFGLKNAVSLCNRVMSHVFEGIDGICVYLDDVLIHARTIEEHDIILRKVFERIRAFNLSLNRKKCSFYKDSVSFLGFLIRNGKVQPDPDRTEAISRFPTPSTIKQLQRFLGMANFFRDYVPRFSSLTSELYDLLKNDKLIWTKSALESFNRVKDELSECILDLPLPNEKLELHTDASEDHIAGCLMNYKKQPISFVSKKLNETQRRWSTLDKEAYAIIWAIQKLRPFLLARQFTVFSDHKPLKYLFEANSVSAKVHRWRISISDFSFDVKYIPGEENVVADSLSRVNLIAEVDEDIEIHLTSDEIRKSQASDIESSEFRTAVQRKFSRKPCNVSDALWSVRRRFKVCDDSDILCFDDRLFIPSQLRSRILTSAHYGHQGIEAMLSKLAETYFWPKMKADVKSFVANCRICSLTKPRFVSAQLKPYLLDSPMQMLAADYVGPLPSDNGYKYMLVIIDTFSRFPEVYPVKDMTTQTLITTFRDLFSRYGFPDSLLTDRGTQFQSDEFWHYLNNFQIRKLSTTAYRPSSNGLCERFNGTIQKKLKALLCERNLTPNQWTRVLPTALLAYRNEKHATTGFTPSELFFSFRVKDLSLPPVSDRYIGSDHFTVAADNIAKKRNRACDRHHYQNRQFPTGTEVVIKSPTRPRKLETSSTQGVVVDQPNPHVVRVNVNGHTDSISSARISPLPKPITALPSEDSGPIDFVEESDTDEPSSHSVSTEVSRPVRNRRLPSYLDDFDVELC